MYRDKLTRAGFKVVLVFNAEDGLKMAKKESPDLIILDILLPKANGISFLQKQKKDPKISSIPVVAFSNYDDPDTKKQAFQLGVKDYLIKTNYAPNEVVAKIKQLLVDER